MSDAIFAGFADPAIAGLGDGLDHRLAGLLTAVGIKATEVLRTAELAARQS